MNDEMKTRNHESEDQEILQLLEMLSQLPEAPVPDEFDLRLRRALKEETAKRREDTAATKRTTKKPVWKKWTAMAACLMVGFLSFQMIQGGVGSDMMEGKVTAETADIGEIAGPVAIMEGQLMKLSSESENDNDSVFNESVSMDQPGETGEVAVEDIVDGDMDGSVPELAYLGAGMGIDGEMLQLSRGEAASQKREAFMADCDKALILLAEGIAEGDSRKLAEAMNYKNSLEYTEETAEHALKLYSDFFDEEETTLTWKNINVTAWSRSHVYRLTDGTRSLVVIISDTADGLKMTEPVMEHSEWLYEQIGGQDFTLVDVIYSPQSGEVEFLVDLENVKDEVRSFVWRETEL